MLFTYTEGIKMPSNKNVQKEETKKPRFSIRKLHVGTTSVLLGFIFMGTHTHHVKAATATDPHVVHSKVLDKTQAKGALTDKKADKTNQSEEKPVKQDIPTTTPKASQYDAKDTKNWGSLNIADWKYEQNAESKNIDLTDYTGNKDHIVIPNNQDFIKAGKLDKDHQVTISSDIMHKIIVKNQPITVAISKTNGGKVVASDTDWSNAFGGKTNNGEEKGAKNQLIKNANNNLVGVTATDKNLKRVDISNLDVHNVQNFSNMFNYASNLSTVGDLSNWDVSHGTNFQNMFKSASSLTTVGDLSNWNLSNSTDLSGMFQNARSLTDIGNLQQWNVEKVNDFSLMFRDTWSLADIGSLSKWQVNNGVNFRGMFTNTALNTIDISNWNMSKAKNIYQMFMGQPNIEKKNGNSWIPQTVHHDQLIIAKNVKLAPNLQVKPTEFMAANSHKIVITDNKQLLNLGSVNLVNKLELINNNGDEVLQVQVPTFYSSINDFSSTLTEMFKKALQKLNEQTPTGSYTLDEADLKTPVLGEKAETDTQLLGSVAFQPTKGKTQKLYLMWNPHELKKTITRSVEYEDPSDPSGFTRIPVVSQKAVYVRHLIFNQQMIEDDIQYSDWEAVDSTWDELVISGKNTDEIKNAVMAHVPEIDGYERQVFVDGDLQDANDIAAKKVNFDDPDVYILVSYKKKSATKENKVSANFIFVDDDNKGQQVGAPYVVSRKIGDTITPSTFMEIPDNYELAKDQEILKSYKFNNKPVDTVKIHLVHQKETLDGKKIDKIPNEIRNQFIHTAVRMINDNLPSGTKTTKQTATITRTASYDKVTGELSNWGNWTDASWKSYEVEAPKGYTASTTEITSKVVDPDTKNVTVTITYKAKPQVVDENISKQTSTDEDQDRSSDNVTENFDTVETSSDSQNLETVKAQSDGYVTQSSHELAEPVITKAFAPHAKGKMSATKTNTQVKTTARSGRDAKTETQKNVAVKVMGRSRVDLKAELGVSAKAQDTVKVSNAVESGAKSNANELPSTGEQSQNKAGIFGLALASLGLLFGFIGRKKKIK